MKAEKAEKEYLKKIFLENFEKINPVELVDALEYSGVEIDLV